MRLPTLIGTLALGVLLGMSGSFGIEHIIRSQPGPGKTTWNAKYFVLNYRNHFYHVTQGKITNVGRYLTTDSYHGWNSGYFGLYSIPGVKGYEAIAVATSNGYLLAIKGQPIVGK